MKKISLLCCMRAMEREDNRKTQNSIKKSKEKYRIKSKLRKVKFKNYVSTLFKISNAWPKQNVPDDIEILKHDCAQPFVVKNNP